MPAHWEYQQIFDTSLFSSLVSSSPRLIEGMLPSIVDTSTHGSVALPISFISKWLILPGRAT